VVVRAHYYPAWRAAVDGVTVPIEVPIESSDGQLAFRAPRSGSYAVALAYPRYRPLMAFALLVFVIGTIVIQSRRVRTAAPSSY
jgi:hypothetical protein